MKKILKYTLRILLGFLLLICISLFGGYIYLNTTPGRRWLNNKVADILRDKLGTPVRIGEIEFHLPRGLVLRDVEIEDHHHLILFAFKDATLEYLRYNFKTKQLIVGNIELNRLDFNLIHYKAEKESNFQMMLDRFATKDTTSTLPVIFNNIVLTHVKFHWDGQNDEVSKIPGIDWSHIDIKDFSASFSYLHLGDSITAKVRSMNFAEKSGFQLLNLRTNMLYSNKKMEFKNLYLRTPESEVRDYIRFDYEDINKFQDFIDSVHFNGDLYKSAVSFKDIAFFTDALINKRDIVKIAYLKGEGRIVDMRAQRFNISFGENSYAIGSGSIRGIPNVDEMFMDIRVSAGRSSRKEMMRMLPESQLPNIVEKFGIVSLKGSFTGFINDFVAYGNAQTELGEIISDINLKLGKQIDASNYSGKIALNNFNLRQLLGQNNLGMITMSGELDGYGFSLDKLRAKLNANVQRFDFNNYAYNSFTVNGDVSKKFFNGELKSADKNLNLDFIGSVDYNYTPAFKGNIDIRNLDLRALHFINDSLTIKTKMAFDFQGLNPDNLQGIVDARNTVVNLRGKQYNMDSLSLHSKFDSVSRSLHIYSNILDADLSGKFQPSKLPAFAITLMNRYVDSNFVKIKSKTVSNQKLDFNINFKDMDLLFKLLHTDIALKDSAYLKGSLNSENNKVHIEGNIPSISINKLHFDDIKINADSKENNLLLNLSSSGLYLKDSLLLNGIKLNTVSNADHFAFHLNTEDGDNMKVLHLNGNLDLSGNSGILNLDSSQIVIADTLWNITSNQITLHKLDSFIDVPLLQFSHGNQRLKIVGQYGRKTDYPIRFIVEDISIRMLSPFLPSLYAFKGDINGQILLNGINAKPIFEAGLFISPLIYQKDTIGILDVTTSFDQNAQKLRIESTLKNFEVEEDLMNISGDINFAQNQEVNLKVKLDATPLSIFTPLMNGLVTNLSGKAKAEMKITGTLASPIIGGAISLLNTSMKVDYLQTIYHFSHDFVLSGKTININNLDIKDVNDHSAIVNGRISIPKLSEVNLDLNITAKNFQMLNTKQQDNELYYGIANATGKIAINGPYNNLKMFMQLTSNKGTQFYLPIGQGSSYSGHDYITFVDHSKKATRSSDYSFTGLTLNMELNITPDAQMQIIFDPRVGDIIEGYGHGNLKLEIALGGDFNMYGTYYIDKGSYRFTALDVINKQFSIKDGSFVNWNGNPYEAQLNVQAVYKVRTSLSAFAPTDNSTTASDPVYSRIFSVNTLMDLKGSLFTPEIKLNFDIPELNSGGAYSSDVDNTIRKIKGDEQELNKQVVALLVFNRFIPVSQGFGGDPTSSSVSDLVSSQLSYWLSRLLYEGLTVGADYKGNGAASYRVNADLFDRRVNLNGTYDQNVSRNATYNAELGYKLKDDGSEMLKASSRSSNNPVLQNGNVNTYSLGIFFRKEFDSISDFFKKKK